MEIRYTLEFELWGEALDARVAPVLGCGEPIANYLVASRCEDRHS